MPTPIAVLPPTHAVPAAPTHTGAAAGDALLPPDDGAPQVAAALDALQDATTLAQSREAELRHLVDTLAELSRNPTANADAIADLKLRIDLATVRADRADLALMQAMVGAEATLAQSGVATESHRELFARMAQAAEHVQNGYVREAQKATQEFIAFFRAYTDIMGRLNTAIRADTAKDKEGYVIVTFDALRADLDAFIREWEQRSLGTFASQADAERFLQDTGLVPMQFPIRQTASGTWEIAMPVHVAAATRDSMPPEPWKEPDEDPPPSDYVPEKDDPISWNNAQYQAWLSGNNNRQEALQNDSRIIVEYLSRVNQISDNIFQTWSQALQAIADVDRHFAQSL